MINKKNTLIYSVVILMGMFLFLLVVNYNTPMIGEDFALSPTLENKEHLSFMDTVSWVIDRIQIQSTTWNARLGEQLAIVFLAFNKDYFNILNSIVALIYGYLIFLYAFNRKMKFSEKSDLFSALMIFLLVIIFMPVLGEIFFWETGATNYLWSLVLLLMFGYPYKKMLSDNSNIMNKYPKLLIPYFILSFLSGMTNENTVVVFGALVALVFFIKIIKKQKIFLWMYISVALYVSGVCCLFLSPSTKIRTDYYNEAFGIQNVNLNTYVIRLKQVFVQFINANLNLLFVLLIVGVIFAVWHRLRSKTNNRVSVNLKSNIYMLLLSILSLVVLMMAPYVETRAFFLAVTMMIGLITYMVSEVYRDVNVKLKGFYNVILFSLLVCVFLYNGNKIYHVYSDFDQEAAYRENKIILLSENTKEVKVEPFKTQTSRIINTRDEYLINNHWYSDYYGINYIDISQSKTSDSVMYNIENNSVSEGILTIIGWAFLKGTDHTDLDYKIVLQSDANSYVFEAVKEERKDVTEYYPEYNLKSDNTGFMMQVSVSELQAGEYKIGIVLKQADEEYTHWTDQSLSIEHYAN